MVSTSCPFCGGPVNPHDIGTWKQVKGWVHGPKADSMTMREYTGEYAHDHCVKKAKTGQAPDQPDIFTSPLENIEVRNYYGPPSLRPEAKEIFGEE